MVNPDDFVKTPSRSSNNDFVMVHDDSKETKDEMKEEAMESSEYASAKTLQKFFKRKSLQRKTRERHHDKLGMQGRVYLPILIIPGIASSGLYVEESSIDNDAYQGERVWMNAAFLAKGRLQNKVLNKEELEDAKLAREENDRRKEQEQEQEDILAAAIAHTAEVNAATAAKEKEEAESTSGVGGFFQNMKKKKEELAEKLGHHVKQGKDVGLNLGGTAIDYVKKRNSTVEQLDIDHYDYNDGYTGSGNVKTEIENDFATTEEEIMVKNSWIQHVALDKNMIDERPGNKVRVYEGLKGCEYMVDDEIAKTQGYVWAQMVEYCTTILGYEREKNIDAAPYDWRLAPALTETRDGYLTKTMLRIEQMYEDNQQLPIILCCHSMGCKMGHYFLNFALSKKGQEWLDKYVHTYMPIAAPHGGVALALRTGATGSGLTGIVDALVGNPSDGLTMYRSWSSGNWLMPRLLPNHQPVFPPIIVRREGELGVTITSNKIDVSSLFKNREKPPRSLRLTVQFRNSVEAHTDFHPVNVNEEDGSLTVSFRESFYLAVPYLGKGGKVGDGGDGLIGELVFYFEEPAGRLQNQKLVEVGKKVEKVTEKHSLLRTLKKKASKFARDVAHSWGLTLRVACNETTCVVKVSDFKDTSVDTSNNTYTVHTTISMIGMDGGSRKDRKDVAFYKKERSLAETASAGKMAKNADWGSYLRRYPDLKKAFGDDEKKARIHFFEYGFKEGRDATLDEAGTIALKVETVEGASAAPWSAYLQRYPDLQKAFGEHNTKRAKQHWFEFGFKEQRNPFPDETEDGSRGIDDADTSGQPKSSGEQNQYGVSFGELAVSISYSPPPMPNPKDATTSTPIAITNDSTLQPPIVSTSKNNKSNDPQPIEYDIWSGTELFKQDGFVGPMFPMVEEYYEQDPIGPLTKSSFDAPPVRVVRSIYGINVNTEAGCIYRKVPVVTIGDKVADCRYMIDTSAAINDDEKASSTEEVVYDTLLAEQYKLKDGIVWETPQTLQNVPGQTEQRRVCGDGTVPYWNMVHALTWKDQVDELTVDELEGAVHRTIITDERFFALLKRYCRVVDPRANAMLMMKQQSAGTTVGGINALSGLNLRSSSVSTVQ